MINVETDCDHAVEAWEQICSSLAKYHQLFLFVDFDGTLSELTAVPSAATLDDKAKAVLRRLCVEKHITIAVLSGRSVSDVADRVDLPVIYAGDHGLEIRGPDFEYLVPGTDSARLELPAVCNEIRRRVQHIPGALVEAKRLTASLHYRLVDPDRLMDLEAALRECVDPFRFEVRTGKCLFEIRPRLSWNKGDAVELILKRLGARPQQAICVGDDETDEDMFRSVPQGINVRILDHEDRTPTAAPYWLHRSELANFLNGILDVIHGMSGMLRSDKVHQSDGVRPRLAAKGVGRTGGH